MPVRPTRWSHSGSWGSCWPLREAGPRLSTHARVGGDTSRFVALVIGASHGGPDTAGRRSLARRSKMSSLYTSTMDTSTFRLLDGFSEISLGGGTRGTQPLWNLGCPVRKAAGKAVSWGRRSRGGGYGPASLRDARRAGAQGPSLGRRPKPARPQEGSAPFRGRVSSAPGRTECRPLRSPACAPSPAQSCRALQKAHQPLRNNTSCSDASGKVLCADHGEV